MSKKFEKKNLMAVLVRTSWGGIFFGYIDPVNGEKHCPKKITLHFFRNCVRYTECKGLDELTLTGPNPACRIGPECRVNTLYETIVSVTPCEPKAVKKWDEGFWS